jgi:type III pantothenate kinase
MPTRTLVLSLGNSTLNAGVFAGSRLVSRFQAPIAEAARPGGIERLLKARVRGRVDRAALSSVVPSLTGRLVRAVTRACGVEPRVLSADGAHGLRIGYRKPGQLGADRLAAALGARAGFRGENVVVVDFGTATTVTALSRGGVLLGGAILPGLGLWAGMLAERTALLPRIEMRLPRGALGRSTREGMRSGIFHGHAGAVRELVAKVGKAAFRDAAATVVGTGGHSAAFRRENLFKVHEPDLVLRGLLAYADAADDRR